MNNLIYEYVPSENIVKISPNDFKMLLKIKDNYEKLIRIVPNNVLQQRIDKAIEQMGITDEDLKLCNIIDVNGIEIYKILKGSE